MTAPSPGSTVYVRWYGKTLQGEVVPDDHRNPLFRSMLHVRIPVQGTPVIAVFAPAHVYDSPPSPLSSVGCAHSATPPQHRPAPSCKNTVATGPDTPPSFTAADYDAHMRRYRQFLADHWDHDRNHLRTDALEESYQLFRQGVVIRQQLAKAAKAPATQAPPVATVPAASPAGPAPKTLPRPRPKPPVPKQLSFDF